MGLDSFEAKGFRYTLPILSLRRLRSLIPVPEDKLPFDPRKSEKLFKTCPKCASNSVDPILDVCDGWIDSSITPLFVTGQYSERKPLGEAYPVDLRIQGQDIIRTWLFYTIFRC